MSAFGTKRTSAATLCCGQKRTSQPYSITSSAMESKSRGTSMPRARAVWRLMMNSNLVDCSRNLIARGQGGKLHSTANEKRVWMHEESIGALAGKACKGRINLADRRGVNDLDL